VSSPRVSGSLEAPPNAEASGLAASRRNPGLLWITDDSGSRPEVYAVDTSGRLRGRIRLEGVSSGDWEDLATAVLDGRPYLLVADTGDNDAKRSRVFLHFIEEPSASQLSPSVPTAVRPVASLRIAYPDGPRDCEAVAIDPRERAVYLLSKRDPTPRLYRIDLPSPLRSMDVVPRLVGEVGGLPQRGQKRSDGRVMSWPTAMDFSPDGSAAAVLTYGQPVLFRRWPGEAWASALSRAPSILPPHNLPQAEAMAFSADGSALFVASEKSRSLLRYDLGPSLSLPVLGSSGAGWWWVLPAGAALLALVVFLRRHSSASEEVYVKESEE
jgi:hypothetical protein